MILQLCNPTMWKYIMQDIGDALQFLPQAAEIVMMGYLICLLLLRNNLIMQKYLSVKILFLIYLLFLIQITLLTREPGSRTAISLKFLETLGNARANAYVIENLILFI